MTLEQLLTDNLFLVILASLWSLPWKGVALWKAASKKHKIWFIVLLLVNLIGILEILYIFVFSDFELPKKRTHSRPHRKS